MNKRLTAISEKIGESKGFVDVGTDHGYLPLYMLENGYKGTVIASDINEDPLNCAVQNARQCMLEDRIRFILCDGLDDSVREDVDTIVIAGMGGDTICGILDRAPWCFDSGYKLILQPMSKAEILRYWLAFNDFDIFEESFVADGGTVYQIISARYGKRNTLSDAELYVGKYEFSSKESLFMSVLQDNIVKFCRMGEGLRRSQDKNDMIRSKLSEEIYTQLLDMKERYINDR